MFCPQDVVLVEPRNRLPGTEGLAAQWDLPYDVSRDDSHGTRTSGEVQSARRGQKTLTLTLMRILTPTLARFLCQECAAQLMRITCRVFRD